MINFKDLEQQVRIWYALLKDECDNDWGYGFCNYVDAIRLLKENDYFMKIAVIKDDEICIDEIYRDDI